MRDLAELIFCMYEPHMRLHVSSSLSRRLRLPHPVRRRAPTAGTVGLRNPASRELIRVRGNQVFGSAPRPGSTTSSSDDEFLHTDNFFPDLSDFFDNLNMGDNDSAVNATDARPEGPLSAEEQEKFEKVDAMFKAALFSILGDNNVDPYMAFDHGKDAWDALEAKFGVSDAGTELYVMEQYYDYRMTDERSVVEQAHEIHSLAKELEQFKCRKDFLRPDGKRFTCFCSWCWYGGSEVYFGKDHPAEECAAHSLH
ncbi:hypothetical protein QYE76_028988 [Lolium multiflorum]|uniref:Uncharacterized protein n=1 Tax=Lolium multiflorum TaxID=4521 RepID=A0AAD8VHS6_LOLMU|nr:hypothetical protein QYE76_028988 [Lolium multiflorum]